MGAFYDFKAISAKIPFKQVLDHYGIPYEGEKSWKGNTGKFNFVIDPVKNVFFVPQNKDIKGGVINFVGFQEGLDLRQSAKFLTDLFLKEEKQTKKLPELELQYDKFLEKLGLDEEFCKKWEVGRFKGKGIMAGRITAKCYDHQGEKIGYVGYDPKKDKWLYPKGFRRPVYNVINSKAIILVPGLFDCLHLLQHFPFVSGLLGASMTDSQAEYLAEHHQRILLIHPKGENVRNRLSKKCFVKWVEPEKPITELSLEDVKTFF